MILRSTRAFFVLRWLPFTLALFIASGCGNPTKGKTWGSKTDASQNVQASTNRDARLGTRYDLARDEERGGHTLSRHVGRSEADLRRRLNEERISAASSYHDRDHAEKAVATALAENNQRVESWLNRQGGHPNLVVDYRGDPANPVGLSLRRGESRAAPCSNAVVVLRWVHRGDFYVLTSYPECRR